MATTSAGGNCGDGVIGGGPPKRPEASKSAKKSVKRDYRVGKKFKSYTLQDKEKVIKMLDEGQKTCDIVKVTGIPESTIRNIKKKKDEIKKSLAVAKRYFSCNPGASKIIVNESSDKRRLLAITEHFLLRWINRREKEKGSVDGPAIREQASIFYEAVCRKKAIENPPPFIASVGWLKKFKRRCELKKSNYQGEISSADAEAALSYPPIAEEIIREGGYNLHQVYNADETGLYWKKSPKSTYISKREKQAPGVKMAKDRITILLTTNATGSHKLKPLVIYRSKKPRAYKNCDMNKLNVVWFANKKGYMTMTFFTEWFDKHFVPKARAKCEELNLAFKVILFLDNAPGHAKLLVDRHPSVKVCFLPPNTTSKIQPLDQEIIANVKLLYYKVVHNKMRHETDSQQELIEIQEESDDEMPAAAPVSASPTVPPVTAAASPVTSPTAASPTAASPTTVPRATISTAASPTPPLAREIVTVKAFWKSFNIKQAVDFMVDAWKEINDATINHAWAPLLPTLIQPTHTARRQRRQQVMRETVEVVRSIPAPGFNEVDEEQMTEVIQDSEEIDIEEMLEVDEQDDNENEEERSEAISTDTTAPMTTTKLSHLLSDFARIQEEIEAMVKSESDRSELVQKLNEVSDFFMKEYNKKINEKQQALITRYLNRRREVEPVPDTVDDDIDLENMPEDFDFEGFGLDEDEKIEEATESERRGSEPTGEADVGTVE